MESGKKKDNPTMLLLLAAGIIFIVVVGYHLRSRNEISIRDSYFKSGFEKGVIDCTRGEWQAVPITFDAKGRALTYDVRKTENK